MTQRRITILAPTPTEADALGGLTAAGLIVSGVGMAETASTVAGVLASGEIPGLLILAGIAGAYPSSGLVTGDCVAVECETVSDMGAVRDGVFTPLYRKEYLSALACRTGLKTATSATVSCIGGYTDAPKCEIENMEGAAFFAACTAARIPFIEVRAISNLTTDTREDWDIPKALVTLREGVTAVIKSLEWN